MYGSVVQCLATTGSIKTNINNDKTVLNTQMKYMMSIDLNSNVFHSNLIIMYLIIYTKKMQHHGAKQHVCLHMILKLLFPLYQLHCIILNLCY